MLQPPATDVSCGLRCVRCVVASEIKKKVPPPLCCIAGRLEIRGVAHRGQDAYGVVWCISVVH